VLRERFPRLIHCRISGFGADGPLGGYPGYDAIVQAMAGWFSVNGESGGDPTRLGLPMVGMGTGLYSAVAILMALAERSRSGLGQFIDMTLYDCALALLHPHAANYALSGKVPAGPIHDTAQALAHPHTVHRRMFLQQDGYAMPGTPIKFFRAPGSLRSLPPSYGEHTREVLLEMGLCDADIETLLEAGVVLERRRER
jgi:crotonobetainyl-CoA:carnitine CoA-transferase CaiB-like acyl-CoA transferase